MPTCPRHYWNYVRVAPAYIRGRLTYGQRKCRRCGLFQYQFSKNGRWYAKGDEVLGLTASSAGE